MKGYIVFLLAFTVCAAIVDTLFYWRNVPLGEVPTESRKMIYDLMVFMVGVVSGYVGHADK